MSLFRILHRILGEDLNELYVSHRERAVLMLIKYLTRIASFLLIGVMWMVIVAVVVILLGISLGYFLGDLVGSNALGFLLSAVVWCGIGGVLYLLRRRLVERPVVVKLRKIFLGQ